MTVTIFTPLLAIVVGLLWNGLGFVAGPSLILALLGALFWPAHADH